METYKKVAPGGKGQARDPQPGQAEAETTQEILPHHSIPAQCLKRFYVDLYCHRLNSHESLVNLFAAHPEWRQA